MLHYQVVSDRFIDCINCIERMLDSFIVDTLISRFNEVIFLQKILLKNEQNTAQNYNYLHSMHNPSPHRI